MEPSQILKDGPDSLLALVSFSSWLSFMITVHFTVALHGVEQERVNKGKDFWNCLKTIILFLFLVSTDTPCDNNKAGRRWARNQTTGRRYRIQFLTGGLRTPLGFHQTFTPIFL